MANQWNSINNNYKSLDGYKRVAWPPTSEERLVREFTPQPHSQSPAPGPYYAQQPSTPTALNQQYRPAQSAQQGQEQQHHQQQQQQQVNWSHSQGQGQGQPTSFYAQNDHQTVYQQQQQQVNDYHSYSQHAQHSAGIASSEDQLDHRQRQSQSIPREYRCASPGIITLRKEVPSNQQPAPVFTSQPAAVSYQGGNNMRGDLKWPPPEYKEAAARENEERRKVAQGPACRPRRVQRDYTDFFAKHALNNNYPTYKVPPGTQHMLA